LGSLGATVTAPTEPALKSLSLRFSQVMPAFVVRQTPPPVEPM